MSTWSFLKDNHKHFITYLMSFLTELDDIFTIITGKHIFIDGLKSFNY